MGLKLITIVSFILSTSICLAQSADPGAATQANTSHIDGMAAKIKSEDSAAQGKVSTAEKQDLDKCDLLTGAPAIAACKTAAASAHASMRSTRQAYVGDLLSCVTRTTAAKTLCLENSAPALGKFMNDYGPLIQAAGGAVSSISGSCEDLGKAINAANMAMSAYQVACASSQGLCESACTSVAKTYTSYNSAISTAGATASIASGVHTTEMGIMKKNETVTQGACVSFKVNTANAMVGIIAGVQSYAQAKSCETKTAETGGIDCTNPQNASYNSKACMCTRNELPAAECQGMGVALSGGVKAPPISSGDRSGASVSGEGGGPDLGIGPNDSPTASLGGSAGGAGAPVGGGSGAGGGGAPGGGAQDGVSNPRRINTNIIGGFGGGGGGGGGTGGPGYGEVDAKLLKQAAEKSRSLASQTPPQITGQAGRSNWEKVKSRYIDNTNRLITSPR